MSTIISAPIKSAPKQHNDLRPVAQTPLVIQTLEKIVKSFIFSSVQPMPATFWIRCIMINTWIELPQYRVRILFADFSSAFNTVQPHVLAQRLIPHFSLQYDLVLWIVYLFNEQITTSVCEHVVLSASCHLHWISPGLCFFSPPLHSVYR